MTTLKVGAKPRARFERLRPFLVALGAGFLYGSWAAFANRDGGFDVALRAAVTQALLSVVATLVFVLLLERLFRWPASPRRGFVIAFAGTSAISAAAMVSGHVLAGTPNVATTVAPSLAVGTVFYFVYARMLLAAARG